MAAPTIGRRIWTPNLGNGIEWSHPSTAALVSCAINRGGAMVDIARSSLPLVQSGSPTAIASPFGPASTLTDGTAGGGWDYPDRTIIPTGAVTVLIVNKNASGANTAQTWGNAVGAGTARGCFSINYNGTGTTYWDWGGTSGAAGGGRVSTGVLSYGAWEIWAFTAVPGSGAQVIYRNGNIAASSTNTGATRSSSADEFHIGRSDPAGASQGGSFALCMVWSRALPHTEVAALSANPYAIVRF